MDFPGLFMTYGNKRTLHELTGFAMNSRDSKLKFFVFFLRTKGGLHYHEQLCKLKKILFLFHERNPKE